MTMARHAGADGLSDRSRSEGRVGIHLMVLAGAGFLPSCADFLKPALRPFDTHQGGGCSWRHKDMGSFSVGRAVLSVIEPEGRP